MDHPLGYTFIFNPTRPDGLPTPRAIGPNRRFNVAILCMQNSRPQAIKRFIVSPG